MIRIALWLGLLLGIWGLFELTINPITGWADTIFFLYGGILFLTASIVAAVQADKKKEKVKYLFLGLLLFGPLLGSGIYNLITSYLPRL